MYVCMYVPVIKEFGGDHDTCDEEAMDIEWCNGEVELGSDKAIQVSVRGHEARRATIRVLKDPFHILLHTYGGCTEAVEYREPVMVHHMLIIITFVAFDIAITIRAPASAPLFFVFRYHLLE